MKLPHWLQTLLLAHAPLLQAWRIGTVAGTLLILYLALSPAPPLQPVPLGDKALHLVAFFTLALAWHGVLPTLPFKAVHAGGLLVFGMIIEAGQGMLAGRDMSGMDLLADAAGIAIYALALAALPVFGPAPASRPSRRELARPRSP